MLLQTNDSDKLLSTRPYLRDDVEVGDERRLQDDGDVGRVEQLDGVAAVLAAVAGRLDRQVHAEALGRA